MNDKEIARINDGSEQDVRRLKSVTCVKPRFPPIEVLRETASGIEPPHGKIYTRRIKARDK